MGSTDTTITRTAAPRGAQESSAMQALLSMARSAGGQMGDMSALASGDIGMPNAYDQQLVEQSVGASTDIAQRELQRQIEQLMAQYGEQMAARGIQGSSIEAMQSGQIYSRGVDQMANLASQGQQMGANALMNLPFQRAQTQIGANQLLFNKLVGGAQPVLEAGLQERLSTMSQSQSSPIDWMGLAQRGAEAYSTMGFSEAKRVADSTKGNGDV